MAFIAVNSAPVNFSPNITHSDVDEDPLDPIQA